MNKSVLCNQHAASHFFATSQKKTIKQKDHYYYC